jgi:hypothetical protein
VSFLKRLFGGTPDDTRDDAADQGPAPSEADLVAAEQDRERELIRADAERLDDDLIQRQMRYADRSWTPPAQGGARRADDEESTTGDG